MALIKPKDGARLGLADPMCHVKSTEDLTTEGHERFVTEPMIRQESRMKTKLYSHLDALERPARMPEELPQKPGKLKNYQNE